MKGNAQRGAQLAFGSFGIKAMESTWITGRQIEAGACRRNRNGYELQRTFDDDFRDACLSQTGIQILADLSILDELAGKILPAVPVGIPTADDTKSVCYRINFLSHLL